MYGWILGWGLWIWKYKHHTLCDVYNSYTCNPVHDYTSFRKVDVKFGTVVAHMPNIFWSLTDLGEIIESTPFPSLTFFGNFISYVHDVHMEEIELQKRVFACFANTSCANRRKCKRRLMQSLLIVTTSQQLRQIMKTLSNRFISFTRSEIPFNTATLTNLILSNGRGGAVEC